jgi:2-hydroxychromene-2-carboxylate isomerase
MCAAPFSPLNSTAPLIIYIDYKSPYAYLAKDPTYAIEDELGIEVDWRPFTLDIPSYLGSARLDHQGQLVESQRSERQWTVVRYSYRDIRRYAALRGLITRGTSKIWNSSLAAIGMLWAKRQDRAVLRRYSGLIYERFWKRELDIEDLAVIEGVLKQAGAQTQGFQAYAAGEGLTLHNEIQRAAFDAGIFGVPTYIVNGEIFFGREHLSRIRWMLSGRQGLAPDVGYERHSGDIIKAHSTAYGPLSVAIDFKSPTVYLAIAPTCALAEQLGVAIEWQPFLVSPRRDDAAGSGSSERGTRHRRLRADYIERDVMRYAANRGLTICGLQRQTDSSLAGIGLLWMRHTAAPLVRTYLERIFEHYWREQLDIQDENAVRAFLAEIGAPTAGFAGYAREEGRAELGRLQLELANAGVFEVPTYLLNGEVYVGRQHLPLIRAMLSGKSATA